MLGSPRRLAFLLAALAFAAPGAAAAQPPPPQPVTVQPVPIAPQPATPQPFNPGALRGRIFACPAARGEHLVRMDAGRRYAITASAANFDPYLRVLAATTETVLAEDDDSGGGVTPRVVFVPAQTGDYRVLVSGVTAESVGDYALNVTPLAPLGAPITRPSRVEAGQKQLFDAALGPQSSTEFGRRYQDYELRLGAGEAAMIHVQGQNVDTALQIFTLSGRGARPIAEDDDGGGGRNPFLFFAPAQPGTYVVRVIGVDEQAQGAYRLRISR